jgi:Arc-like DNA binding dprotein
MMARKKGPPAGLKQTVQLKVRLREFLRSRLERAAARNGRSMNSEIVERLNRSFHTDADASNMIAEAIIDSYPAVADRIEEIYEEVRAAEETDWEYRRGKQDEST